MTMPALDPPLVALFDALRGQLPAEPIEDLDERRADARTFMLIHPGPG